MVLTRYQIEQLAIMAGYEVKDITGSSMEEEFVLYDGLLVDKETNEPLFGLVASHKDYPDELTDKI